MTTNGSSDRSLLDRFLGTLWGNLLYVLLVVSYMGYVSYLVYAQPRFLPWRLLFMLGLLLIFYIPRWTVIRYLIAALVLMIIVPILGVRQFSQAMPEMVRMRPSSPVRKSCTA